MKITDEFKVGLVTVIGIVVLVIGIFFLKGINVFSSAKEFYAYYDNTNGLKIGSPFTVNGFQIGLVREMKIDPSNEGKIRVMLHMENEDISVPKDSKVKIYSADLLGSKGVMLTYGSSAEEAVSGDVLQSEEQEELMDMIKNYINPLEKKAETLVDDLDTLIAVINGTVKNFDTLAEDLTKILPELKQSVIVTINSANELIIAVKEQTLPQIQEGLMTVNEVGAEIKKMRLERLAAGVDSVLTNLNDVANSLKTTEGTVGKLINSDEMHEELTKTTTALQSLLNDIENNPNKYVHVSVFEKRTFEEKLKDKEDKKKYKEALKEQKD